MISNYAKTQVFNGALALILLLTLTTRLNSQPSAQAKTQTEGSGTQAGLAFQAAVGTAFSYQGRLDDGGTPANGTYTFRFRLYASPTGMDQVGSSVIIEGVNVSDGLFGVQLDFGQVFDGTALYLEVAVQPGGGIGEFDVLSPRRLLGSVPYALNAASIADGAVTASSIGEPCGEGQVLARLGGAWACADATLDLAPQQLVSHTVQIDGTTYLTGALQANLLTLGASDPGGLLLVCLQPCSDINEWYVMGRESGSWAQKTITVTIQGESNGLQQWVLDSCEPRSPSTALSPNGHDLYPVFAVVCDRWELFFP